MTRKLLTLVATLLAVLLPAVPVAHAYPPGDGTDVTSEGGDLPGDPVSLTATGFTACAGSTVTFTITPPGGGTPIIATAIANSAGIATVTVTLPPVQGTYTVVATSPGCDDATTSFVVSELPRTGGDAYQWVNTAAIAVAIGLGLLVVARRRRRVAH